MWTPGIGCRVTGVDYYSFDRLTFGAERPAKNQRRMKVRTRPIIVKKSELTRLSRNNNDKSGNRLLTRGSEHHSDRDREGVVGFIIS